MNFSKSKIVIDGKETKCCIVGDPLDGWVKVQAFNEYLYPVSEHDVPSELFTLGGTVKTGGHTYQAIREEQTMKVKESMPNEAFEAIEDASQDPRPAFCTVMEIMELVGELRQYGYSASVNFAMRHDVEIGESMCVTLWKQTDWNLCSFFRPADDDWVAGSTEPLVGFCDGYAWYTEDSQDKLYKLCDRLVQILREEKGEEHAPF